MLRLLRFFVALIVLVGLLPCEIREAIPLAKAVATSCCPDDAQDAEHTDDAEDDCCASAACRCPARATAGFRFADDPPPEPVELPNTSLRLDPPTWRAGPPPTPPPIV